MCTEYHRAVRRRQEELLVEDAAKKDKNDRENYFKD